MAKTMSMTPVEKPEVEPLVTDNFLATPLPQETVDETDEDLSKAEAEELPLKHRPWCPEEPDDGEVEDVESEETRNNINNNEGECSCQKNAQILKIENATTEMPSSGGNPSSSGCFHGPYTQKMRDMLPEGEDALRRLAEDHLEQLRQQNLKLEDKRDSVFSKLAAKIPSASVQMRLHYFIANKVSYDRLFQQARVEGARSQGLKGEIEKYNAVVDVSKKLDELQMKQLETEKAIEKQRHYLNQISEPVEGRTAELNKELTVLRNRYLKAQRKLSTTPGDEMKMSRPQTQQQAN